MNNLVKIISYDKLDLGEDTPEIWGDEGWHLSVFSAGDMMILCSGTYYELGSSNMEYETKMVKRGGITCQRCLDKVRFFKSIKL